MSELLKSKKFVAALVGVVAVILAFVLGELGMPIPEEKLNALLAMLGTYILGQGIADHGKEAAKVVAPAAVSPAAAAAAKVRAKLPASPIVDKLK